MRIANFAAAAAALSMIAAPVAASAQNPAAKLSIASSSVRAGTVTKNSSKANAVIAVVAVLLIVGGIGAGTGLFGNGSSTPDSQ